MEKKYYTSEEARKLLNKSRTAFYKEVQDGIIPSEIEKGQRRGRKFPREAIEAHLHLEKREDKDRLRFIPSSNSDLWARVQNSIKIYGAEDTISYQRTLEWKEINNEIFMSLIEGEELIGAVTIMPLEENIIHALIEGEIWEKDIPNWAIKQWNMPALSVYVPTIAIIHSGDVQRDRKRGLILIRQTWKWIRTLHCQYDIKNWYAIAATEEGEKLLQHVGFHLIHGKRKGYTTDAPSGLIKP